MNSLAIAATTLALYPNSVFAQESTAPPIFFHKSTDASQASAAARSPATGQALVTFPATSSAPLRWKSKTAGIRLESHIEGVDHTVSDVAQTVIEPEGTVKQVAFTLELDSPKNGQTADGSGVRTVAGTDGNPTARSRSVLSARKPAKAQSSPFKDPFGDRQARPATPSVLGNPGAGEPAEIIIDEEELLVQDEVQPDDGPPVPGVDPDDPAPVPPATLRTRPTAQDELSGDDPSPNPLKDLPTDPPGRRARLRDRGDCGTYNDRDCCEDEEECLRSLDYVKSDQLRTWGADRLDITARYKPDADTPEEIEAAERRKAEQLRLSGSKDWKDRSTNRVIAHGQLVDLVNGKAVIQTDDGQRIEIRLRGLSDDELCFIAAWYNLPTECTLGTDRYAGRQFIASTFTWKASDLCHKPLYFEEVQLERYGHTAGPIAQPFVSGAHFFANIALLPYKMGINPPQECQYALGYYRPGSCAPWMVPPIPLSPRGALTAAGVYTAGAAIIP